MNISETMCILCNTYQKYGDYKSLTMIQRLDCFGCTKITTIPSCLINLRILIIAKCSNITTIPTTLTSLKILVCDQCNKLTTIPNSLVALRQLSCSWCPLLLSVPSIFHEDPHDRKMCDWWNIDVFKSDWLPINYNLSFQYNFSKLLFLQHTYLFNKSQKIIPLLETNTNLCLDVILLITSYCTRCSKTTP